MKRRDFIKGAALIGAGLSIPGGVNRALAANSPNYLKKWVQPLRGLTALGDPKGIPCLTPRPDPVWGNAVDFYEVTAGEFKDLLHPMMGGSTTLWGYYDTRAPVKRHLGGLIIASRNKPVRIRMTNALPTNPIIPADTSGFFYDAAKSRNRIAVHLHGGYIPAICDGGPWDWFAPDGKAGPGFLNGPGGALDNIPTQPMRLGQADYFYPNQQSMRLMWYHDHAHDITRTNAYAGIATGYLVLDGIDAAYRTISKVIPDLDATIPLIWQDKVFVGPTTLSTDPTWPLAVAPRKDLLLPGSLWYEHVYAPVDQNPSPRNPLLPLPNPSCIPEFFGDTILCNGTVYPLLTIEAKRYRFLMLNACNARFLNLNLFEVARTDPEGIILNTGTLFPSNPVGPDMVQIGNEGGFLFKEVRFSGATPFNPATVTGNLQLGNAERADVVIDFTGQAGKDFVLYTDSAAPNPGGGPDTDYFAGNPAFPGRSRPGYGPDTRQLLRIRVVPVTSAQPAAPATILDPTLLDPAPLADYSVLAPLAGGAIPAKTAIPPLAPAVAVDNVRELTLNEDFDDWGRLIQKLGTTTPGVQSISNNTLASPQQFFGRGLEEPATEVVAKGAVEVWNIYNTTGDVHPIHFHLTNYQILWRANYIFDPLTGAFSVDQASKRGPDANELGWKETIRMNPGEVISLITKWDMPNMINPANGQPYFDQGSTPRAGNNGLGALTSDPNYNYHEYVWHCHILEHEEHDMMRPLVVAEPKS